MIINLCEGYSSSKYCWTRWSTSVKDNRGTGSASIRHESVSSEIQRSWGAIFYNILQYSTTLVIAIINILKHSFEVIRWFFNCLDVSSTITIMFHNWVNGRHHQSLWSTIFLAQNIRFPLNIIILHKRLSMCWHYLMFEFKLSLILMCDL